MAQASEKNVSDGQVPGCGASGRYSIDDEFAQLASAVSALSAADLNGISDYLGGTDSRDTDASGAHQGGGFLANQF